MWLISASGLLFTLQHALQEAIQIHAILVFVAGKPITVFTNEAVSTFVTKEGSQDNQGNLLYQLSHKPLECGVMQKYPF